MNYSNILQDKTTNEFISKYGLDKFNEEQYQLWTELQELFEEKKDWEKRKDIDTYKDFYEQCLKNIKEKENQLKKKEEEFVQIVKGSGIEMSFLRKNIKCIERNIRNEMVVYPDGKYEWLCVKEGLTDADKKNYYPDYPDYPVEKTDYTGDMPSISNEQIEQIIQKMKQQQVNGEGYVNKAHEALYDYFLELKTCQLISKQETVAELKLFSLLKDRREYDWDKEVKIEDEMQRVLNTIQEVKEETDPRYKRPKKYEEVQEDKRQSCSCGCNGKAICVFKTPLIKIGENEYFGGELVYFCEEYTKKETKKIKFFFDFTCSDMLGGDNANIRDHKYAYIKKDGDWVCRKCWKKSLEK